MVVQAPGLVMIPTVVQFIKNPHQRGATSLFPTRMFFNQLNRACHGITKLASVIQLNTNTTQLLTGLIALQWHYIY